MWLVETSLNSPYHDFSASRPSNSNIAAGLCILVGGSRIGGRSKYL